MASLIIRTIKILMIFSFLLVGVKTVDAGVKTVKWGYENDKASVKTVDVGVKTEEWGYENDRGINENKIRILCKN